MNEKMKNLIWWARALIALPFFVVGGLLADFGRFISDTDIEV
jgi:hypothetical protein